MPRRCCVVTVRTVLLAPGHLPPHMCDALARAVLDEAVDGAAGALDAAGDASPEATAGPCKSKLQLARGMRHVPY